MAMSRARAPPPAKLRQRLNHYFKEENMSTETTCGRSPFGDVLERLMRRRGLEPGPANVRELAARSGLDGDGLLRRMAGTSTEDLGLLRALARELDLSEAEKTELAVAYTFPSLASSYAGEGS